VYTLGADSVSDAKEQSNDGQVQKVAGYASQAGSFLSTSASGDAAASTARGMVTGATGGALQQWLSHFGTARVQLDADKMVLSMGKNSALNVRRSKPGPQKNILDLEKAWWLTLCCATISH
jgi:hypothetical protein